MADLLTAEEIKAMRDELPHLIQPGRQWERIVATLEQCVRLREAARQVIESNCIEGDWRDCVDSIHQDLLVSAEGYGALLSALEGR